jgi:hypothetical protein
MLTPMSVDELLARARHVSSPVYERLASYQDILAHPKVKAAVKAEAAVEGLILEFHQAPDPSAADDLAARVLGALDLVKKSDRDPIGRLVYAALRYFDAHDLREPAVVIFLRYLDFQPLKTAWAEEAVRRIPRFLDDPRVLERVGAAAKLPSKLAASQPAVTASLRPRARWMSRSPYGADHPLTPRVGGTPSLPADRPWPRDAEGRPMHFVAQLRFDLYRWCGWPDRGMVLLFASDAALRNSTPAPALRDDCAAVYVADVEVPLTDPAAVAAEIAAAFGGPIVGNPGPFHDHIGLQPISGDDYRFSALVPKASAGDRAKWTAKQFNLPVHNSIGGYPKFARGQDPRTPDDEREADALLVQIDSDPAFGLRWPHQLIQFVLPAADLIRADFSRVRLIA